MFRIAAEGVKIHWTNDEQVRDDVMNDIKDRFMVEPHCECVDEDFFIFDTGGCLKVSDVWFEFVLNDGLVIHCRSLHWDRFLSSVERHLTKDYAQKKYCGKFYKIHGYLHTLCLSDEQAQWLVKSVNDRKQYFNSIAELSWKLMNCKKD